MKSARKKGFDWNKKQLTDDPNALQKIIHDATKKLKSIELKRYNAKHGIINSTLIFRSVGNYGEPDANGDVFMPGCITYQRGGEYKGLKREMPTKFIIDHNPNPINWLGPIMDEFGIKAELLKLDEHGTTYQPITNDQKREFKDKWADLVPDEWYLCDGKNTPLKEVLKETKPIDTPNWCNTELSHDISLALQSCCRHSYEATEQQHVLKCTQCGKTENIGI